MATQKMESCPLCTLSALGEGHSLPMPVWAEGAHTVCCLWQGKTCIGEVACDICGLSAGLKAKCTHPACSALVHPWCAATSPCASASVELALDCVIRELYCHLHSSHKLLNFGCSPMEVMNWILSMAGDLVGGREQRELQYAFESEIEAKLTGRQHPMFPSLRACMEAIENSMRNTMALSSYAKVCSFYTEKLQWVSAATGEFSETRESLANTPLYLIPGAASAVPFPVPAAGECTVDSMLQAMDLEDSPVKLWELQGSSTAVPCCICQTTASSSTNALHTCMQCHEVVHSSCGYIASDALDWLCHVCQDSQQRTGGVPACDLCGNRGGIMWSLHAAHGFGGDFKYIHILCAVHERPRITHDHCAGSDRLAFKLTADIEPARIRACSVCQRTGVCKQCCVDGCSTLLHVTCSQGQGFSKIVCTRHSYEQLT